MGSFANHTLPIIEFSEKNLEPGSISWLSTAKDVVRALENYGCFIAIYSKFSLDMHQAIFRASEELFDLPTDIKVKNISNTPTHGYVGQLPFIPLYESLGIENATTPEGVQGFIDVVWPSGNERFGETTLEFSKLVGELDQVVMRMVSESYGIETSYQSLLEATSYLFKFIKYREPAKDETDLGIVPHTDKTFMSILHQHQVKGLEIMTKEGDWILVDPSPSSFIVMAGEACTAWTNGRIEASTHRVVMKGSEERYSLGFFSFIRDVEIQVPEELVDDDHPLQFKPFYHYKFLHFYDTQGRGLKFPIKAYCGV